MRNRYASRSAETAVIHGDGTRHCAWCGDHIDPIDWCGNCTEDAPCAAVGGPHRRLRKRSDAAFCDGFCRSAYQRDTGPNITSDRYRLTLPACGGCSRRPPPHPGVNMTDHLPDLEDQLCDSEFPGDDLFAGQLCERMLGPDGKHDGDHEHLAVIAGTRYTRRLVWPAEVNG